MPDTLFYNLGNGNSAIVTICRTEIKCPTCATVKDVNSYFEAKKRPNDELWRIRCTGCKRWLGFTYDMRGDAVCWDEKEAIAAQARRDAEPPPTPEQVTAFEAKLAELANGPSPEEEARQWLADYDQTQKQRQEARRLAL